MKIVSTRPVKPTALIKKRFADQKLKLLSSVSRVTLMVRDKNIGRWTLREIGALVGEKSPQKIKHHITQLEKRGLIRIDRVNDVIEKKYTRSIPRDQSKLLKPQRDIPPVPLISNN